MRRVRVSPLEAQIARVKRTVGPGACDRSSPCHARPRRGRRRALPPEDQSGRAARPPGRSNSWRITPAASAAATRDEAVLGGRQHPDVQRARRAGPDPLSIGGQITSRAGQRQRGHLARRLRVQLPSLLDGTRRAPERPRPRLRARPDELRPHAVGNVSPLTAADPIAGSAALSSVFGALRSGDPAWLLDQLWLRFDIGPSVF